MRLAPALRRQFSRPWAGTIAIAAAITVPALPALTSRYGFSDDYSFLGYEQSARDLLDQLARNDRPLLGVVYAAGRPLVGTIDALVWARVFGLAGVFVLALGLRAAARTAGFSARFALTLAIAVGLLPSVQLYAAWASCAPYGWVSAASILASQRLVRGAATLSLATRTRAVALLVVGGLTYQPAAGFFIVGLVLALLSPQLRRDPRALIAEHARVVAIAAPIVLGWVIFARIALGKGERTPLAQHPSRKASWFFTEVLDNATNPFDITPSHIVEAVVLVSIVAVIVMTGRRLRGRHSGLTVVALVAAVPIIYTPNLIVEETWAAYRTLAALSALVLVFIIVALREVSHVIVAAVPGRSMRRRLDGACSAAVAASLVAVALLVATTFHRDLVQPQTRELAAFRAAMRATYGEAPARIAIRQLAEPPAPPARYDEFRVPSLAKEWVPVGLARAVLRADGRDPDALRLVRLAPGEPAPAGATVIEIDTR